MPDPAVAYLWNVYTNGMFSPPIALSSSAISSLLWLSTWTRLETSKSLDSRINFEQLHSIQNSFSP